MAMLRLANVNQYYGESHILWDVSLTVPPGACVCLVGRNGVGKTTLLKTIMGLLPVRVGRLMFDGQEFTARPAEWRARHGIGYVPQGREIFPQLTVEENLLIGLLARRDNLSAIPSKIFEWFPVLRQMLKRKGGDLSGGQQQQLAIGRALVTDPKLLILDEPTEGLQPNIVREIGDIILRLNRGEQPAHPDAQAMVETLQVLRHLNQEEKLTVLLVEQKLPFARRLADSFALMEKGAIVASGTIHELTDDIVRKHLSV